ncbi:hypothetical protein Hanom_Chr09g00804451 [Helianthus anomalus]
MGCEVLLIIQLSCLRAGGGRVFAHLGEPRGWRRSSSRPWPQRPMSRRLVRRFFLLKKSELVPNSTSQINHMYSNIFSSNVSTVDQFSNSVFLANE